MYKRQELYYTARPDGDGIAESATSDVGETDTINRTLYYATKFDADPDTAGDWTEYTTQPADNATFATAKAALLAGLNDTDATAETRGTLPLSLKMVRTTSSSAGDLLLDTYTGAAAAYSVRKLDKDYTGYCMKVREDSGDTEADIGFDGSGGVNQSAIATHCGSANGYVVTWYDQSGNSNNATQSTASSQPQIYNGTAVITENSKPTIDFAGSQSLLMPGNLIGTSTSMFWTLNAVSAFKVFLGSNNSNYMATNSSKVFALVVNNQSNGADSPSGQTLYSHIRNGSTTHNWYKNGSALTTTGTLSNEDWNDPDGTKIGGHVLQWTSDIQEFVLYNTDQSSNRTGIETNIDTYFSIT